MTVSDMGWDSMQGVWKGEARIYKVKANNKR